MWDIKLRKKLVQNPFVTIEVKEIENTDSGRTHEYFHFAFPDFCNVIAVTETGEIVLVRQFRAGIEDYTFEVPGGLVDAADKSPIDGALRELREETGYTLLPQGRVIELGWTHPNPAIQHNRCHFFAVGPVARSHELDNDPEEQTEVVLVPANQISDWIRGGKISHALVLNAFFLFDRRGPGAVESDLTQRLLTLSC